MRYTRFTSLLAAAVIVVLAVSPASAAPVKVWCLGDSITLGRMVSEVPNPSYRYSLHKQLTASGMDVDFVGTQFGFRIPNTLTPQDCLDALPDWSDQEHDGWSGYPSQWILNGSGGFAGAANVAATLNPDIVLLHIGTNDAHKGYSQASSEASIQGIINAVRTVNPNVEFYVAQIIPVVPTNPLHAAINSLSAWIGNNIEAMSTSASPVHAVDMNTAYSMDWFIDGVHPDNDGEDFMADQFFAAMTATPEPASITLMLLGAGTLIRRRR